MPGSLSPSDTYGQFKRALRNLFRRRKFNTNVSAVVKPQAPTRPPRPRSASAVAAPEVFNSPDIPSWPIFGQLPQGGGLYCAPVELPGSLAPVLQHRSKSDAGQPIYHSDLFSELDATSIRRLSVIGSEDGDDEHLEEAYLELQAELNARRALEDDDEQITPEQPTQATEQHSTDSEEPDSEHALDDALFEDAEEHLALEDEIEDHVDAANIALPEGSDSDLENDNVSIAPEAEEFARNDSANGGKVFHDDSSSLYSTDESENDADSATDVATVSTPRTASLLRADMMEYFDEKIPVVSETPQVLPLIPAPGMAATSGPLEEFSW
ncbi:hypothetical protein M436DRAFT_62947 [Aureobasidium namibiae CBS 147.97]|uniref:Uncharacterized protein n=1 Tax=Aureobasidium namibiae CBS 147.97 TaxID=1043004 RepID=A0A074WN96_9PEZI